MDADVRNLLSDISDLPGRFLPSPVAPSLSIHRAISAGWVETVMRDGDAGPWGIRVTEKGLDALAAASGAALPPDPETPAMPRRTVAAGHPLDAPRQYRADAEAHALKIMDSVEDRWPAPGVIEGAGLWLRRARIALADAEAAHRASGRPGPGDTVCMASRDGSPRLYTVVSCSKPGMIALAQQGRGPLESAVIGPAFGHGWDAELDCWVYPAPGGAS